MAGPGASSLAARCTACHTVFRVVPDQLRVSDGWVRCGRCGEVFNAAETLVDLESGAPRRLAGFGATTAPPVGSAPPPASPRSAPPPEPPPPAPPTWPPAAPEPEPSPRHADDFELDIAPPPAPVDRVEPVFDAPPPVERDLPDDAPLYALPAAAAPAVAEQAASLPPPPPGPAAAPAEAPAPAPAGPAPPPAELPSFLRRAERGERWRRPQVRAGLAAGAVLLSALLLAQALFTWRDLAAARWPVLAPLLSAACRAAGCAVGPARAIEQLSVESSALVRVERSDLYRLSVALRNRADIALALPALDLSLTDTQGRLLARRVLRPAELGASAATLAAGRELSLQAALRVPAAGVNDGSAAGAAAAAGPVAGYTIELFYP